MLVRGPTLRASRVEHRFDVVFVTLRRGRVDFAYLTFERFDNGVGGFGIFVFYD